MVVILDGTSIALEAEGTSTYINFISHAHSDHIKSAKLGNITASLETLELIKEKIGNELNTVEPPKTVTLIDSGHILGSKQLFIRAEELGLDIVFTGDYQLQESPVANKIEIKSADALIIDSTYPYPNVKFDPREEVIAAIQKYTSEKLNKGIVLFGAYAIGKAQELISIMNDIGIIPVVDKNVARFSRIYNKFGLKLRYSNKYENYEEFRNITHNNFVAIATFSKIDKVKWKLAKKYEKRIFTGVATGFAKMFKFNTDVQFALSDHADFSQALEYIRETGVKKVYTYGKNSEIFAKYLRKVGIDATQFQQDIFGKNKELCVADIKIKHFNV